MSRRKSKKKEEGMDTPELYAAYKTQKNNLGSHVQRVPEFARFEVFKSKQSSDKTRHSKPNLPFSTPEQAADLERLYHTLTRDPDNKNLLEKFVGILKITPDEIAQESRKLQIGMSL